MRLILFGLIFTEIALLLSFLLFIYLLFSDDGTDNSDHEREWEKQQLQKAGASTKVSAVPFAQNPLF